MPRLLFLLLALCIGNGAAAADRLIPVITGTIGDRTYRTTVDLRSATTEECRFELRMPDGASFHSIEPVEGGKAKLLDEFAAELEVLATTILVSCTGSVEVHSRIYESEDGGATYSDGPLFSAVIPNPLMSGQTYTAAITGDFVLAEIHGAPAKVTATLTATSSNRIADREYDLPPFGECSVGMAGVLRALGPINGQFVISGKGTVIVVPEIIDPTMANRARRRVAREIRARLDAKIAAAPASRPETTPTITRQLLISPFNAAPFYEPATGLVLMRDRWYDPSTGTFLTPDPEGYRDSSNPYTYCAGDPVNCSDPTGRHSLVKRKVNGLEFELLAPDPDEVRRGELGMSGSFINPFTGTRESFTWDQHQAELLLMQARSGNPLIKNAFEQFYGMPDEQVDVSGLRLYWNSLWHHKTDIALSGGITVSMLARRPPPVTAPHARSGPRIDLVNPAPAGSRRVTVAGIPANATYAQRTYGPAFDAYGRFSGLTVEDVTARLRAGRLTPADLRVDFIVREGNTLILNTRTAQALEQAGIPRSQWVGVNRTGVPQYEDMLTEQLRRNNLTPAGTPAVRPAQRPQ